MLLFLLVSIDFSPKRLAQSLLLREIYSFEIHYGNLSHLQGSIPENFQKSIKKAFEECMANGPLLGAPVWGLRMTVTGGQTHEVDSSDFAFATATKDLVHEMFQKHKATLLEPVMDIEVTVPTEAHSDVSSLLAEKMAEIKEVKVMVGENVILAQCPLRAMFGFIAELRGATKGMDQLRSRDTHSTYYILWRLSTRRLTLGLSDKLFSSAFIRGWHCTWVSRRCH